MSEQELFKTTIMGGFDKEDVLEQVQRMRDDYMDQIAALKRENGAKDEKIAQLTKRLDLKDSQQMRLEEEVRNKYQKYIDKYESIGRLVFEAQIKSEEMLADTQAKCDQMLSETQAQCSQMLAEAEDEAQLRVDSVQVEVDEKLAEGKKKYIAVQEELNEIVELINQAQNRFMASYKEVHNIISTMPDSLKDFKDVEDVDEDIEDEDIGDEDEDDAEVISRMEELLGEEDED